MAQAAIGGRMIMGEYVKREYVIDAVLDVYYDTPDINLSGEKFEAAIRKIPAADVSPVVHGKWDDRLDGITPYCSVCGMSHSCMRRTPLYCPNCGAKMDGDAND